MTGSLQTKNNKFYVVLNYKDEGNKIKRKWIATGLEVKNNKVKAQQILKGYLDNSKILEVKEREEKSSVVIESFMLFVDFLDNWLELRKGQISSSTMRGYWHIINRIKSFFASKNTRLSELRPLYIEEYYRYLFDSGVDGNTVLHHHVVIRKALDYACKNDLIGYNPADKIERPKKGKYHTVIYNKEELHSLFEVFKGTVVEIPVFLTAFYGLRRREVLGLKWSAIDYNRKCIEICHKVIQVFGQGNDDTMQRSDVLKNDSSHRTLPLLPQVEELLEKAKKRIGLNKQFYGNSYLTKDQDYVCLNPQGELIKPSYLTEQFSKILKQSKLKHIRFHDLRHSCASAMLAEGVPMKQIQEWLGHATFSTTADIYSHLDYSSKLESAKRVGKVFEFYGEENFNVPNKEQSLRELMRDYNIDSIQTLQEILQSYRKSEESS